MTKSIGNMLKMIDGLRGTKYVTTLQDLFIKSCIDVTENGTLTANLSCGQAGIIEMIYEKNFG